jgi:hypothetical protein
VKTVMEENKEFSEELMMPLLLQMFQSVVYDE